MVIRALVLVLALSSCGGNTNKRISETKVTEEDLFIQRCASCHGIDGGLQASNAPDLRKTVLSRLKIMEMIDNGGNGMPAFKTIIMNSKDKSKIVDYVLTLRK